jgi:hypothetical protein
MSDYEPPYRLRWKARAANGAAEFNAVLPPPRAEAEAEIRTLDGSNLQLLISNGVPRESIDGSRLPSQSPPLWPSVPPADGGSIP